MRNVVLFFLFFISLIALTAIRKDHEESETATNAYRTGVYHKMNGMKYDDSAFSDLSVKRTYAFGWMADTD